MKTSTLVALALSSVAFSQERPPSSSMPDGLETLSHGVYYRSPQRWEKLEPTMAAGMSTKHGGSALVGVPPGVVWNYQGVEASLQLADHRPVFYIRVDASRPDATGFGVRDLLIIRTAKKKDHRELEILRGGFASVKTGLNERSIAETTLTAIADRTYSLSPDNDLEPGEYILTVRGENRGIRFRYKVAYGIASHAGA